MKEAISVLDAKKMNERFAHKGMTWKFIPPASPHMGGVWERMVHLIKTALAATLTLQWSDVGGRCSVPFTEGVTFSGMHMPVVLSGLWREQLILESASPHPISYVIFFEPKEKAPRAEVRSVRIQTGNGSYCNIRDPFTLQSDE
ncbi:uncharacterized protein LOC123011124 [Tribolium madens]|uniref:uncharacterized protein LOC123011124 n=1 Tax=Tribolium madens TaxID=41895 RepID=UPI001CF74A2B|nr:uncharacterized protein LOC123011124 [Tribolium madens]